MKSDDENVGSPDYWRERARRAREMAAQMEDAFARDMVLGIASDYERLAEAAKARSEEGS